MYEEAMQEINVRRIQHGAAKHGGTKHGEAKHGETKHVVAKHWEAMPRCGEEYEGYRQWSCRFLAISPIVMRRLISETGTMTGESAWQMIWSTPRNPS